MPTHIHAATLTLLALACQDSGKPANTVPGPEADDLLSRARGLVVITEPVGGIEAVAVPKLTPSTPRKPGAGLMPVHSLAGPDGNGRIAFVENDMMAETHSLKLIHADGSGEETIFQGKGDALWKHAVGEHLALDSGGKHVALVARCEGVQLRDPDAYLMEGELEIWSLAERKRVAARPGVLDDVLAWFPDGKRLAYTALIDSSEAKAVLRRHVPADQAFGSSTAEWTRAPVVHVLDVETGKSEPLHAGQRCLVSPDGRTALVRDFELHWRLLELETNVSKAVEAPGAIYPGAIAFVDSNTVLSWAWPTEGSEAKFTEHNSPLVGKKPMRALKLFDLRDGRFQTVVPFVDPRHSVSFGAWGAAGG